MNFKKCFALLLALAMMVSLNMTCFAADDTMEVPDESSGISPYAEDIGPTIGIKSTVGPANASTRRVYITIPENQTKGVYFRASVVGDAGTSYTVFVDYPNGRIATVGVCRSDGKSIQVASERNLPAGTYTFRFSTNDQASANSNEVGFIAAIYQRL